MYTEGLLATTASRKHSLGSGNQKWTQLQEKTPSSDQCASVQLRYPFLQPGAIPNHRNNRARANTSPTKEPEEIRQIVDSFRPRNRVHGAMRSDHSITSITDSLRTSVSTKDNSSISKISSSDGLRGSTSNTQVSGTSPPPKSVISEGNRKEEIARLHEKRLSAFRNIPAPAAGTRGARLSHVWPNDSDRRTSRLSHVWVSEVQEQKSLQPKPSVSRQKDLTKARRRTNSAPGKLQTGKAPPSLVKKNSLSQS